MVLILSVGSYFLFRQKAHNDMQMARGEEALPVQKGVVLTVKGGQQIVLNRQHQGKLNTGDGSAATQEQEGLAYNENQTETAPVMHTLTNNSAEKFDLTLADGSVIFLDVASSVSYPTAFPGRERRISITGQAYLKVKHNNDQPFLVNVQNEVIEDIGTEFNINAYPGDVALTTLTQGAVKVSLAGSGKSTSLKPGQQVLSVANDLQVRSADLETVTAWLQGKLVFHREPLENIMKQVARIYNVEITWADNDLKKIECGGSFSRTRKLANVLNSIRKSGQVDFSVEGRTIKVIKAKK